MAVSMLRAEDEAKIGALFCMELYMLKIEEIAEPPLQSQPQLIVYGLLIEGQRVTRTVFH